MNCTIQTEADGVRVLPQGDIDMHVAPELRKILHRVVDGGPSRIVMDLAGVPFIDSSGIATIVEVLKLSRQRGGTVRVENCRPSVRDTFDIAGLTKILGIQ